MIYLSGVSTPGLRARLPHMGRVNSRKRLVRAAVMGCDSADGTFLRYAPTVNLPRMLGWLHELALAPVLDLNNTPTDGPVLVSLGGAA